MALKTQTPHLELIPDDVLEQGRQTAQAMNIADFVALTTLAEMSTDRGPGRQWGTACRDRAPWSPWDPSRYSRRRLVCGPAQVWHVGTRLPAQDRASDALHGRNRSSSRFCAEWMTKWASSPDVQRCVEIVQTSQTAMAGASRRALAVAVVSSLSLM
jgi:hypothetical protein